jgi:hypothetical protein
MYLVHNLDIYTQLFIHTTVMPSPDIFVKKGYGSYAALYSGGPKKSSALCALSSFICARKSSMSRRMFVAAVEASVVEDNGDDLVGPPLMTACLIGLEYTVEPVSLSESAAFMTKFRLNPAESVASNGSRVGAVFEECQTMFLALPPFFIHNIAPSPTSKTAPPMPPTTPPANFPRFDDDF